MRSSEFPTLIALKEIRPLDNGTALALLVVVPLPNSPVVLLPQQYPLPPTVTPHETALPASMVENVKVFVGITMSLPPQPVSARPINKVLTQWVTVMPAVSLLVSWLQSYNRGRAATRALCHYRFDDFNGFAFLRFKSSAGAMQRHASASNTLRSATVTASSRTSTAGKPA
jgi:hypothetical protein